MIRYSLWKNLLIISAVLLAIFYALPNIYGSDFALQISNTNSENITNTEIETVQDILDKNSIEYKNIDIENKNILIRFNDSEFQISASSLLKQSLDENYIVAFNLAPAVPQWLELLGGRAMSLGLDLRGGVHFLLEVDMDTILKTSIEKYYNEIRTLLRKDRLYKSITNEDNNTLAITFTSIENKEIGKERIKEEFPDLTIVKDSEIDSGFILEISPSAKREYQENALKQNIVTLRNRVNELGVAEPTIQQQGLDRIVVQLPGVQDTTRAKEILGSVATIEFRMVDDDNNPQKFVNSGLNPVGSKLYYFKDGAPLLLKNSVITTGDNIIGAYTGFDTNNAPMVNIQLDSVGGRAMLETTKEFLYHRMAVVYIENKVEAVVKDGVITKVRHKTNDIINAATIQGTFSNRFQITGLDSMIEARDLALLLRAGSLSAPIEIIEERTIGPSLGADNIKKGFLSVIVGFIAVLIFMAFRYRVFGMAANLALSFNLIFIVAILSLIQATLTLPGIAGIVLTVGMAIDANVLIFERIKEELKMNDNIYKAISCGYEKAMLTIADANITTLIAAIVLFSFGTGAIKGFAITLSIGIVTSMFTAIILSRSLINFIYGSKKFKRLSI